MRKLILAGKTIQDDGNAYVIAEIGHNHQGDLETAKKMFRIAKECGADAVKLQKRNNRKTLRSSRRVTVCRRMSSIKLWAGRLSVISRPMKI